MRRDPLAPWLAPRRAFGAAAFACLALIGWALWLQYGQGEEPCPLCILQRAAVLALAVVFAVAAVRAPAGRALRGHAAAAVGIALAGAGVAGWHLRLQHLPRDRVPECGPGLEFMLEQFPLVEVLGRVFRGSGECAEAGWRLLGLTIPGWTLLWFLGLAVLSIAVAARHGWARADD
ncbi:MAG: disulfide bond formation protein B [Pseudomonadota bacterium]